MKFSLLGVFILYAVNIGSQIYIVNTDDDIDNGVCNAAHCSFREAINASEADSGLSTILFNIPGPAPHIISPNYPYPNINNSDLTINGESQPGGPGAIVMDFKFNKFYGDPFWQILAPRFNIRGIDFKNYLLSDLTDMLFRFGSFSINIVADNSRIENCSFISDSFQIIPDYIAGSYLINVENANHIVFSKCNFGTDHSRSFIGNLDYAINAGQFGGNKKVTIIDSNLFLTKSIAIKSFDSLIAERNIFGTLDTTTNLNCVKSDYGIHKPGHLYSEYSRIRNNYFFGFQEAAIFSAGNGELIISNNQFNNNITDIKINVDDNFIDPYGSYSITNNVAIDGRTFLSANNVFELYFENNEINNYDTAYYHKNNGGVQKSNTRILKHNDNRFNCISKKLISLNPHTIPWHTIPIVKTVNRDQITGIGNPNDSIIVNFNQRINCPDAICEGGNELGRTQADGSGNWVLNVVYPNKSTISAYQFDSDPNKRFTMYSEFSTCYQCPGMVKTNFNQTLCPGQTTSFHGKIYSSLNPVDSFLVKGDDVSICDSIFLVRLDYNNSRSNLDVSVCYSDTLQFGPVKIHANHLIDSFILKSALGCDSIISISGKIVGLGNYSNTYCDSSSVKIGSTVFDKNTPSGIGRISGGATSGCDSVIFVNLTFNFSKDTLIDQSFCPNQILNVSGQVFDKSRPSGDVVLSKASSSSCDSIIHVNLSFPNTIGLFSKSICSRDSILIGNQYFSERNLKGTVTLTKATSYGCDSIVNVDLTINPPIQLDFEANDLKCNQANTGELILKDISGGSGNFKVSIDNGAPLIYNQGDTIENLSQGSHSIRIMDQLNCNTSSSFTINNSQLLSLQLPNDTIVQKGNPVSINANTNFNPISIAWNPNLYLSCDTCLNPQSNPDNTITYILTLIDENGCIVTDNMTITVLINKAEIFVPSAFSPNGDNINDIFSPIFKFPNSSKITVFRIFDRWGNQIYERLNEAIGESFGWDGTANGEKMNPGVYIYSIQFVGDDKVLKWKTGDITLVK
ncbi:MAG: gliding motility-associated C-terminal domain-containing protein [Saprospiraceae bacterium]|nr:gliding motility-associated C-terminal domain-containing protein [Saprospiraceae bacterium]